MIKKFLIFCFCIGNLYFQLNAMEINHAQAEQLKPCQLINVYNQHKTQENLALILNVNMQDVSVELKGLALVLLLCEENNFTEENLNQTELIIKKLVIEKANLEYRLEGRTALHLATINNSPKIVSLLLELGAHVDAEDLNNNRRTSLHYAVILNHPEVAQILLNAGANKNLCEKNVFGDSFKDPIANIPVIGYFLGVSSHKTPYEYAGDYSRFSQIRKILRPEEYTCSIL